MPRVSIAIFMPFMLSYYIFEVNALKLQTRSIIEGQPAESYPFYVKVIKKGFRCGGTIVSPNTVLTTGHCLFYFKKNRWAHESEIKVIHGDFTRTNWPDRARSYSCDYYEAHPDYNPKVDRGTGPNDIAVIKLKENLVDVKYPQNSLHTVLCPCPANKDYNYGTAIGLGLVNRDPNECAKVLMEAKLQGFEKCHPWLGDGVDPYKQVCFSGPGKASVSLGDSGGPIVHKEGGEVKCLIGISSFLPSDSANNVAPAVFTRVGFYADWINAKIIQK